MDLEDLLLEAAGRTSTPGKNRHSRPPLRRQRDGSYSDDGSDSRDDESDDDPLKVSRKRPGSQVPLKKRLEPPGKDDDEDSRGDDDNQDGNHHNGSSDESDVGSDLYKNEHDREQLAQMSELDREMILSERAQKKDDQRLAERVKAKHSGKKIQTLKENPTPPSSHLRSSVRSTDKAAAKDDALKELRARRMKLQDPESHRKSRDAATGGNAVDKDISPCKRTSLDASSSESESQSGSHGRDGGSEGNGEMEDTDEDSVMDKKVSYEDIKGITIPRSKLAKWLMEPFFEELIVGCFVRVGIGRKGNKSYYRLCIVKNIDASAANKQYELENKKTHKYLYVSWGSAERKWEMAVISESPPTKVEFNDWVRAMQKARIQMPRQHDVLEKHEATLKANTYIYSPATVKQMLEEKKSASSRPLNIAAEKDRLRRELKVAESLHDGDEVERIQARLQELDVMSRQAKGKDDKAAKLEEMNRKNRAENFKNASQRKPLNTDLKAGDAGYDPFSRRWTRSRNYYVSNSAGGEEAAALVGDVIAKSSELGEGNGTEAGTGIATTAAALEAAADAGKLVDTSAPVDQGTALNSMHNFDLPISLAKLHMLGGPQGSQRAYMELKQTIEATIGYRVPNDDPKNHPHAISIEEYRRRRGLL